MMKMIRFLRGLAGIIYGGMFISIMIIAYTAVDKW